MKTKTFILLITIAIISTPSLTGQIGNVLKNKAAKALENIGKKSAGKAEKEADSLAQEKAEEAIEKQVEEQAGRKTEGREQKGFNFGGLIAGKVDLKYNEAYTFNNYLYMQVEIYGEKEPLKMDYYIYFNNDNQNGGVETRMDASTDEADIKSSIVVDGTNKCMIMLTDMGNTKFGMISAIPEETEEQKPRETGIKEEITKTGNTRIIAGYKCDEYLYRDPEEKSYGKIWVTRDLRMFSDRRAMNKSGLPSFYGSKELEGGAVLATETYDENNKLITRTETKEIKTNISHTITVKGYSLRQVNFNQMESQQPGKK